VADLLLQPLLDYGFMRAGLVGAVLVVLSCLLVVRGQTLLGDAIGHAVLLGVVLGYLVGGELGILGGALIVAAVTGVLISFVSQHAPVLPETAMGVVFAPLFALGLAIISIRRPRGIDLFHVLFGNVLGVTSSDLWLIGITGGGVVAIILLGFRAWQLWSFDPVAAEAVGMRVGMLEYLFTVLLAVAIVAALQTVGVILVIAMLILPGATGALVATRLSTMMAFAVVAGVLSGTGGLYASFHLDVASGPSIVLTAGALFALTLLFAPRSGLLPGLLTRRRASATDPEAGLDLATHPDGLPGFGRRDVP
jgi:manganese transport system permease protein